MGEIVDNVLGLFGAGSTHDTIQAQQDTAKNNNQLLQYMYDTARTDQAPWRTAGTQSVNQLAELMKPGGALSKTNFTMADFQADPGYQWRLQQGQDAIKAAAAANGSYGSGTMGAALVDYGQGEASQEYQAAYSRWLDSQNNLYNRLAGISGTGQVSSQSVGSMGINTAQGMGQNNTNAVNAITDIVGGQKNNGQNTWNQLLSGYNLYQRNQNPTTVQNTGYSGYTGDLTGAGATGSEAASWSAGDAYYY